MFFGRGMRARDSRIEQFIAQSLAPGCAKHNNATVGLPQLLSARGQCATNDNDPLAGTALPPVRIAGPARKQKSALNPTHPENGPRSDAPLPLPAVGFPALFAPPAQLVAASHLVGAASSRQPKLSNGFTSLEGLPSIHVPHRTLVHPAALTGGTSSASLSTKRTAHRTGIGQPPDIRPRCRTGRRRRDRHGRH